MTACTDDERRRVAERLRSFVTDDSVYADVDACHVLHSIGLYYKDIDRICFSGFDVARLADLIEPSCDRDAERACRDTDCDTESITCSECGEITRDTLFWVDVDGGKTVKGHRPRFCSNCGRRVLYDSDDYI